MKKVLISMLVVVSLLFTVACSASYIVAFDTQGGTPEKITSQTVSAGGLATAPEAPTKEGYTFTGWCTDKLGLYEWDFTQKVTRSMTLYAGWKATKVYCTVTYLTLGGEPVPMPEKFEYGTKATKTAVVPVIEGATFAYWSTDKAGLNGDYFGADQPVMAENVTLYAQYSGDVLCTVSFDTLGGEPKPGSQKVIVGATYDKNGLVLPEAPVKSNSVFTGWYFDSTCATLAVGGAYKADGTWEYKDKSNLVFAGDTTLYAGYKDAYVVLTDIAGDMTIVPIAFYNPGDQIKVPTGVPSKTSDGYSTEYYADAEFAQKLTVSDSKFVNLYANSDLVIYVKYVRDAKVVVSFDTDGGSIVDNQVSASGTDYVFVTVPATNPTKTGYTFGGWYLEPTFVTELVADQKFTADATIYAKWIVNEPAEADYFLYNYDRTEILGWDYDVAGDVFAEGNDVIDLRIPEGVKKISNLDAEDVSAFFHVAYLQIPSTLVELGDNALNDWDCLEVISTEKFVPAVLKTGYVGYTDNVTLVVPEQITKVGEQAFFGCDQIAVLKLGNGVTVLPDDLISGTDTEVIYANGATTIGAVFGSSIDDDKVLYANSIMKPVELQTLNDSFDDGRCTVYVNAAYSAGQFDVSADLSNIDIVRGKVADTIEVRNTAELINALQITDANIKLTSSDIYEITAEELPLIEGYKTLPIAGGITVSGSGIVDLSAVQKIAPTDYFKIASGSRINFIISDEDSVPAVTAGQLWYLAQIDNAIITLGADLDLDGAVDPDRQTVTFGNNVALTGCDIYLSSDVVLAKCENLTVSGLTVSVETPAQLAEILKADGVRINADALAYMYFPENYFVVSGKGIVLDDSSDEGGVNWEDSFKINSGVDFTVIIEPDNCDALIAALNKGGLTIRISGDYKKSFAEYADRITVSVPSKTYLESYDVSTVEFGPFVYLEGMNNLEIDEHSLVALKSEDEYHLVELLKVANANIKLTNGSSTLMIGQNIVVPSDVTLDMSESYVQMSDSSGSKYTFTVQNGATVYVGTGSIDAANKAGNVLTIMSDCSALASSELNCTIKLEYEASLGDADLGSGASIEGEDYSTVGNLVINSSGITVKGVTTGNVVVGKVTGSVAGGVTFTDCKIGAVTFAVRGGSVNVDGGEVTSFSDNVATTGDHLVGSVVFKNNVVGPVYSVCFNGYTKDPTTTPLPSVYARTSGYTETTAWTQVLLNGNVTLYHTL